MPCLSIGDKIFLLALAGLLPSSALCLNTMNDMDEITPPSYNPALMSPPSAATPVFNAAATAPALQVDNNATLSGAFWVDEQHCPYCQTPRHAEGKYCYECGRVFPNHSVEVCRHCQAPVVPEARFCYHCGKSVLAGPQLILTLLDLNEQIVLLGDKGQYVLGREVPEQNNFVEIDLGPYGQRKISRRHARFSTQDGQWFLEDLNSKGGTRIDNNRLFPNQPARLEGGMIVYFAEIKCKIEIV